MRRHICTKHIFASYALTAAGVMAALILVVAGLNLAIDRSGFYPLDAWNTERTIVKRTAADAPKIFIAGTSRTSLFPLEGDAWTDEPGPRMNFALHGAQFAEIVEGLERVNAPADAKHIIIGLDFFGFNAYREYDDILHPVTAVKTFKMYLRYIVPVSTLYDRIKAIAQMIAFQFRKLSAVVAGDLENFLRNSEVSRQNAEQPYRDIFEKSSRLFIGNYLGNKYGSYALDFPFTANSPAFAALERLLEEAQAAGTRVSLFIHPTHAWDYELIQRAGAWPEFEAWKRRLAKTVDEHHTMISGAPLFQLFDFSGYNCVTEERVPTFGSMKWHWDVAHFNQYTVGAAILFRLFGREGVAQVNPIAPCSLQDFGQRLTLDTVEPIIAETRARRLIYLAGRPEEMAILDRLWSEKRIRQLRRDLW
jgi:hypothetical protein